MPSNNGYIVLTLSGTLKCLAAVRSDNTLISTNLSIHKMAAILQMVLSDTLICIRCKSHWYIFLEVQLIRNQHRFRWWLGAESRRQDFTWNNDCQVSWHIFVTRHQRVKDQLFRVWYSPVFHSYPHHVEPRYILTNQTTICQYTYINTTCCWQQENLYTQITIWLWFKWHPQCRISSGLPLITSVIARFFVFSARNQGYWNYLRRTCLYVMFNNQSVSSHEE